MEPEGPFPAGFPLELLAEPDERLRHGVGPEIGAPIRVEREDEGLRADRATEPSRHLAGAVQAADELLDHLAAERHFADRVRLRILELGPAGEGSDRVSDRERAGH